MSFNLLTEIYQQPTKIETFNRLPTKWHQHHSDPLFMLPLFLRKETPLLRLPVNKRRVSFVKPDHLTPKR